MKRLIKKFIPKFLIRAYHYKLSLLGAVVCGFPSRKLKVIGITGTKGKSTAVDMASRILEEAGFKTASMSSVRFKIGEKEELNMLKMTMPGRFKIQKFLNKAVKEGCQYAVIEVTSEGISQFRHKFISFKTAVFTNLSPEHIESHGGFENYRKAKLKLFKAANKIHIVNLDDESSKYFLDIPCEKKWGYTLKEKKEQFSVVSGSKAEDSSFKVNDISFKLNLLGEFNIYNALTAISIGLSEGVSLETCKKALEKIESIPGRMEIVISEPFLVVVDYAHTKDSLEKVYQSFKEKRLICVLGSCGGGRDKWKRPELGKTAAKYCSEIIIANEDPYDEDPMEIISEVAKGAGKKAVKIEDRREAIKRALESAKQGDAVIITGKGSEPWMCVAGGKKIPWSDKKIVQELLAKS